MPKTKKRNSPVADGIYEQKNGFKATHAHARGRSIGVFPTKKAAEKARHLYVACLERLDALKARD